MNETFANTLTSPFNKGLQNVRSRNFIVVSMSEDGTFSMSKNPVGHPTQASANAERARLAKLNPGTAYVSMQFLGGSLVPRIVGVAEF